MGGIIEKCWAEIPKHFSNVELGISQIMPNHFHGVINIIYDENIATGRRGAVSAPDKENILNPGGVTPPLQDKRPTLGQIVAYFKYQSTKEINLLRNQSGNKIWQRNYYEHIIRTPKSQNEIYNYILSNPMTWPRDRNHPQNILKK